MSLNEFWDCATEWLFAIFFAILLPFIMLWWFFVESWRD